MESCKQQGCKYGKLSRPYCGPYVSIGLKTHLFAEGVVLL